MDIPDSQLILDDVLFSTLLSSTNQNDRILAIVARQLTEARYDVGFSRGRVAQLEGVVQGQEQVIRELERTVAVLWGVLVDKGVETQVGLEARVQAEIQEEERAAVAVAAAEAATKEKERAAAKAPRTCVRCSKVVSFHEALLTEKGFMCSPCSDEVLEPR